MAVGQKNTVDVSSAQASKVGFDFAIAEECARYNECERYTRVHGDHVISVEYRRADFEEACSVIGDRVSVVLRDRNVSRPGGASYVYDAC
jgi:Glycoside-hydrolase family GH114